MTSFLRTIQQRENKEYVEEILSRSDHFIPLKGRPRRAKPGDFLYLTYHGRVVGRAEIDEIEEVERTVPFGSSQRQYHAKCLVHYRGRWQRPESNVSIRYKGYVGIRYVDTVGLEHLDDQLWTQSGQ